MILVWKNENGKELGRLRYDSDLTDAHDAIANAGWKFGPGETVVVEKDKINKDEVLIYMKEKVNECLHEFQQKCDIEYRDYDSISAFALNEATKELVKHIICTLQIQEDKGRRMKGADANETDSDRRH